jgi:hypothetical protein
MAWNVAAKDWDPKTARREWAAMRPRMARKVVAPRLSRMETAQTRLAIERSPRIQTQKRLAFVPSRSRKQHLGNPAGIEPLRSSSAVRATSADEYDAEVKIERTVRRHHCTRAVSDSDAISTK